MHYRNLSLIGTSHIAAESVAEVASAIQDEKPAVVALELDRKRLYALLHPQKKGLGWKDIRRIGFKGWLFSIIGAWVEKKLGEKVGMKPGAEMMQAVRAAKALNIPIALVDQDIEITLKRFSQAMSWKEKWNLFVDVIKGLILRKSEFDFDLSTVPSQKLIGRMIRQVKKRYPNMYRVLVTERNHVMAKNLAYLMANNPDKRIVAVVGAGHEKELIQLVREELRKYNSVAFRATE
ncbi:MAG: TraB/GumN family protein [Candidatus Woesearchaeota archaeon]